MTFGLTPRGFGIKRFNDIRYELELAHKASLGDGVDLDPETSNLAKILWIYGEDAALIWELGQGVYDAGYPESAEEVSLDRVSSLTAITRLDPTKSRVFLTCFGDEETVLTAGRVVSRKTTGDRFTSLSEAIIPSIGYIDVEFEAQVAGAVQGPAGTLTVIETPVSGWDSVINSEDAVVGRPLETDTELRIRRRSSLQAVGAAAPDAIRGRLLNEVPDITDVLVRENDGDTPDIEGRPPHSLEIIVAGAEDIPVAYKIWEVRAGGIQLHRDPDPEKGRTIPIVNSEGQVIDINFSRAEEIDVWFHIQLTVDPQFDAGHTQEVEVTFPSHDSGIEYSVILNGQVYTSTGEATPADTAQDFVDQINLPGGSWLPITASRNGDILVLTSDYPGNKFLVSVTSDEGDDKIIATIIVENTGDIQNIRLNVAEFASGSTTTPREQTVGQDVYRDRYSGPINKVSGVYTIHILTAYDTHPIVVPSTDADVVIGSTEVAVIDWPNVTVEVV